MTLGHPARSPYAAWAEYYDVTDTDHSACRTFYRSLVTAATGSLLDLGCGTGTNTLAIADALVQPLRVVGVDASAEMLAHARRRAPHLEWVNADMRNLPVQGEFDLVVCCFNTLQLLDASELRDVFVRVRALLSSTGLFAFDVYQPNLRYLSSAGSDRLAKVVATPDGRRLETREDGSYDAARNVLELRWRLVDAADRGGAPIATMTLQVHQHFPAIIQGAINAAGLRVRETFGDFDRSALDPRSRKQIYVCRADGSTPRPRSSSQPERNALKRSGGIM